MVAPAYETKTDYTGSSATSHTVTAPSSIADDDILLALCVDEVTTSSQDQGWSGPSGWERLSHTFMHGTAVRQGALSVFWKRAASESGNYTFSPSESSAAAISILRISGAVTTGRPIIAFSSEQWDDVSSVDYEALKVIEDDTLILAVCACEDETADSASTPSGYAVITQFDGSSADPSLSVFEKDNATAGTVALATSTGLGTGDIYVTAHIAIASEKTKTVPEIRSQSFSSSSATTSFVVDLPPNVNENDGLLMAIAVDTSDGVATPSGWTEEADFANSTAARLAVYSKYAASGDATTDEGDQTVTVTIEDGGNDVVAMVLCLDKDTIDGTDFVSDVGTTATGSNAAPAATGLTPSNDNSLVVAFFGADDDDTPDGGGFSWTDGHLPASGVTMEAGTAGPMGGVAAKIIETAAASGTATFELNATEEWCAVQLAIKPASGSGPQTGNLGLVTGTSSAFAVTASPGAVNQSVGLATGVSSAFDVTPSAVFNGSVGLATAASEAFSVTAVPGVANVAVGIATGAASAFSVTPSGSISVAVGLSTSTASAFSVTPVAGEAIVSIGLVEGPSSAFAVTPSAGAVNVAVGLATGSAQAFDVTPIQGQSVAIGLATGSSEAFDITAVPGEALVAIGIATAASEAFSVGPSATVSVEIGLSTGASQAFTVTPVQAGVVEIGLATGSSEAFPMTIIGGEQLFATHLKSRRRRVGRGF